MPNKISSILVINAGSSSLKFKLFQKDSLLTLASGQITGIASAKTTIKIKDISDKTIKETSINPTLSRDDILDYLLKTIATLFPNNKITIAGHRVVHGSTRFKTPVEITDEVISYLKSIVHMAPLHIPHNVKPMEILKNNFPDIKQVACFDTAFHTTNPYYTKYYALPRKLIEEDNIMRYGFHGLSYEYIVSALREIDEALSKGKVLVCHLGAGSSLAGLINGESFATTMGFTPLDGIPMATRTGTIDPGILLYLMKHKNYSVQDLENLLYYESGIWGLSEESSDFYTIETSKQPKSHEAWKIFIHGLTKQIGSIIACMNGVEAIIFTAGVGENSTAMRKQIIENLAFLGAEINQEANSKNELIISKESSKIKIMVIPTQEELMIAKHCNSISFK